MMMDETILPKLLPVLVDFLDTKAYFLHNRNHLKRIFCGRTVDFIFKSLNHGISENNYRMYVM